MNPQAGTPPAVHRADSHRPSTVSCYHGNRTKAMAILLLSLLTLGSIRQMIAPESDTVRTSAASLDDYDAAEPSLPPLLSRDGEATRAPFQTPEAEDANDGATTVPNAEILSTQHSRPRTAGDSKENASMEHSDDDGDDDDDDGEIYSSNDENSSSPISSGTTSYKHPFYTHFETNDLPIYLVQSSSNKTSLISWGSMAMSWNRTTQYEDLVSLSLQAQALPEIHSGRRPVIMIHCGPKTGSTTLRKACRRNTKKTCGIWEKNRSHGSPGYMDGNKLFPLIEWCNSTYHFCAKEITVPLDLPNFSDLEFVHMFPFRNYDEWARSALKQQYDRSSEKGCNRTYDKLLRDCTHDQMELDFRKYGKTELSKFKEGVVERMNRGNVTDSQREYHTFILYHHRELDDVLERLSEVYGIPHLPGSDGHGKVKRPEGTCKEYILDKYHNCFSDQLTKLK